MTGVKETAKNVIGKGKAGPGRPKGVPNKTTTLVKDAILKALDEADPEGAVAYLKKQATANPTAFLTLVGKVLPMQVEHSNPDGTMKQPTTIQIVAATTPKAADDDGDD
jgi:hypothetical protein